MPGGLKVRRRAGVLAARIEEKRRRNLAAGTEAMDHASLWAIAVNEENAAGGRVVTAPTNGAAGVLPAVLRYWLRFTPDAVKAIAAKAIELKTGARALRSIMENLMLEVMYELPQREDVTEVVINSAVVAGRQKPALRRAGKTEPKQNAA